MASPIGPVIALGIAQEIAPVLAIVQEIVLVTAAEIVPPVSAIAARIRVMREGPARAHVMSAEVAEMRMSDVM